MNYLGYTNLHYVLSRDDPDNNDCDFYYMMLKGGKDVHRISSSCVKEGGGNKEIPCNVMSGDYHGANNLHYYWERVDAPLLSDCAKKDNSFRGEYADLPIETGYYTDGSVYTYDYGATIGEDGAPSSHGHLYINNPDQTVSIGNKIVGQPINLAGDPKYPNYTKFLVDHDTVDRKISFNDKNNQLNPLIDSKGKLTAHVHIAKGSLKLNWDLYGDMGTISKATDEPCNPQGIDDMTFDHECNICLARADHAERSAATHIQNCWDCYNGQLFECNNEAQDDLCHPCGKEWKDNASSALTDCRYRIHASLDKSSASEDIYHYKQMCFDDCNEGTTLFEEGHPTSASCKAPDFLAEEGRWSDLHHACGSTHRSNPIFKVPLNKL